jgi:hypothetical protein
VRNTREIFEFVNNIKKNSENINSFTPIYPDIDTEIKNIEFLKKFEIPAERADRKIIINMKNSSRPQSPNKRRKLIRS